MQVTRLELLDVSQNKPNDALLQVRRATAASTLWQFQGV
jgi:hypothetical protein